MPRAKRDEILRHERFIDDEEGFTGDKSGFVHVPAKPKKEGKGKRSLEDMMGSMPNALSQSIYALERIASAEDQIVKILTLCTPQARELVLKQRPTLARYAPEEEGEQDGDG